MTTKSRRAPYNRPLDRFPTTRNNKQEEFKPFRDVSRGDTKFHPGETVVRGASDGLRREWPNEELATAYLKRAGFELRRDRSWRPPARRKHLAERERGAMLYLIRECGFDGLLTDAQHAERGRQLKL